MKQSANQAYAERLRVLIRQVHGHRHVDVRAHGKHLIVEVVYEAEREPVARATRLDSRTFGLSFRSHTGKWEPMPVAGDLEEIARAMTQELGAYLDPDNL
jgi:hypothetical protein